MKIHLIKEFKYTLVWGLRVEHDPQKMGKDLMLEDQGVIQIEKKQNLPFCPSAGPTTTAFLMTKQPTPNPFQLWQPVVTIQQREMEAPKPDAL